MIRDPSDGTIRENQADVEQAPKSAAALENISTGKGLISTSTSGLATDRMKADELARLEKARDWLRKYFQRKTEPPESGEG